MKRCSTVVALPLVAVFAMPVDAAALTAPRVTSRQAVVDGRRAAITDLNYVPLEVGGDGSGELLAYTPAWGRTVTVPKGSLIVTPARPGRCPSWARRRRAYRRSGRRRVPSASRQAAGC